MKSPRVACYLRVSTAEQSFAAQEKHCRDYARRRGWKNLTIYREKKSGGGQASRPVLAQVIEACRAGLFDLVLVYKLDRFGRSVAHMTHLLDELAARRVGFVCSSQNIDTTDENPIGELLRHILTAVAGFERSLIRERVRSGMDAARERGVKWGRPRASEEKIAAARALRAANPDWSLRKLAEESGISTGYLSRLFRGQPKTARKRGKAK